MIDKNKAEYFFFLFFIKLFKIAGLKGTRYLGKIVGSFVYFVVPIRKKVVIENLRKAFPEKNLSEIKSIAHRTYQNITITFFELMYAPNCTQDQIKSFVAVENLDVSTRILKEGKGFIFLTAHFGSWEMAAFTLPLHLQTGFHVLAQPQRNSHITKWLNDAREKFGNKVIWVGVSVRHIIEALKKGGTVCIAGDQRGPVESERVNFMGVPTSYHMGTPAIVLKTKSQVVVGFAIRQKDFNYKMQLTELDLTDLPSEESKQVVEVERRYILILEKFVREYPDQYFWMHKIWKY